MQTFYSTCVQAHQCAFKALSQARISCTGDGLLERRLQAQTCSSCNLAFCKECAYDHSKALMHPQSFARRQIIRTVWHGSLLGDPAASRSFLCRRSFPLPTTFGCQDKKMTTHLPNMVVKRRNISLQPPVWCSASTKSFSMSATSFAMSGILS